METLADRVRKRMAALEGMTQTRLATLCGVEQPTINRLLHGKTRNPPYIYELAKALETSVKWLKTGMDDTPFTAGGTQGRGGLHDGEYTSLPVSGTNHSLAALLALYEASDDSVKRQFDILYNYKKGAEPGAKKKNK